MTTTIAYQINAARELVGETVAYDGWLPRNAIFDEPPRVVEGQKAVWTDDGWIVVDAPLPMEPAPSEPEPELTVDAVKTEAYRRINVVVPDWMIARAVWGGDPIPEAVKAYAQAVREASDEIEAMDLIPADYADDGYWPASER